MIESTCISLLLHNILSKHFSLPLHPRISSCLKPVLSMLSEKSARPQLVRNRWCSGYIAYWNHLPRDNRTKAFHKTHAPQAGEYKAKYVTWDTVCPDPKDLALAIFSLLKSGGLGHSQFQQLPDNKLDMRLFSAFHSFLFLMLFFSFMQMFLIQHPEMLTAVSV